MGRFLGVRLRPMAAVGDGASGERRVCDGKGRSAEGSVWESLSFFYSYSFSCFLTPPESRTSRSKRTRTMTAGVVSSRLPAAERFA